MWRRRVPIVLTALLAAAPARATVLTIADDGAVTLTTPPARAAAAPASAINAPSGLVRPIEQAAAAARIADELVAAIAWVESRYRQGARSPAGAIGLMQLMPQTARELRIDPYDPAANLSGGAAYLRALLDRFDGDVVRTIAAYNAGPTAVERYRGVPPFPETRRYVAAVMARLAAGALP